jgi:D-alanyl-lipoteichoic acid acyltransferase DltB (MBOAT superfamily)
MVFPSIEFAVFFPLVFAASWLLMPRPRLWKPFVLACSYVFYAAADARFCLLLAGVTLVNQLCAQLIVRTEDVRRRKLLVGLGVGADLLVLGVFKYYGFFAEQVDGVLGDVGLSPGVPLLSLALPVGLSFFTFQAISYVVDVHRGLCRPSSTLDLGLYLSFFPHLVAGPIVRAREFLPQLESPRDPRDVEVGPAVLLICLGLVKKVAIADLLARNVVDPVFAVPHAYDAPDVWLAVYAYAAQIYCDFSGYTDIAIGLALLMGIRFPPNFDRPYRSLGFREFWRRWHMTLSRYLRDYLYIPLGGNRKGARRTAINLLVTMLLGGLWHGAAWGFVLWGGIHGTCLVVEHRLAARGWPAPPAWARWLLVFHLVVLAWVPFRAPDLGLAGDVLGRLVAPGDLTLLTPAVAIAVAVVIGFQLLPARWWERLRAVLESAPAPALGAGMAVTILLVGATVPSQGVPPFIYFAF